MADLRHIVITGVSRGLGYAMVEDFVRRGHVVSGCARSASAVGKLQQKFSPPHQFDAVDVRDDQAVGDWAKKVITANGPPDLLLNNAALVNANAALWDVPPGEFSTVIDVNIKGVFHVLRHFVPAMITRRKGIIVNFSSGWGRSTAPDVAPYCATKWAIEGLTQSLAQELPAGMAAIPLNPGIINTDMLASCFGTDAQSYPTPQQWAKKAVPFLLDITARHNGQSLTAP